MKRRSPLFALLLVALALRVAVALLFRNEVWPDEIFQSQEQGHRLAFGFGLVPWEFRDGVRSWLLPGVLGAIFRGTAWLAPDPWGYLTGGVVALSLLSLVPVAAAYAAVRERHGVVAALVAGGVVAGWYELVYFAPKALNEVVAAHVLCAAVFVVRRGVTFSPRRLFFAGVLAALAVGLRVHLAPAVLVLGVDLLLRQRRRAMPFVAGCLGVVLALGLLDLATWGTPFASYIGIVRANLVEGRAQLWGSVPWWAYFEVLGATWGLAAPVIGGLALVGARKDPLPLVLATVIFASHAVIGHKEYRFLVPALVLVFYSAGLGAGEAAAWLRGRLRGAILVAAIAAWCAASFVLALQFNSARTTLSISLSPHAWQFDNGRGGLTALERIGHFPSLCGVGLVGVPWYLTGGYTYLHRDVQMMEVHSPTELAQQADSFDAAVAGSRTVLPAPFERVSCDDGLCVWRRPAPNGCAPAVADLRDFAPP